MKAVGLSDVGLVRTQNEDAFSVINEPINILENLLIVADGMGGHKAGEIASNLSVKAFIDYIETADFSEEQILDYLTDGVHYANESVFKEAYDNADLEGMGTTFTVASVYQKKLYVAHVGDSRLYVITNNQLIKITHDHSYVGELLRLGEINKDEAKSHPARNALTRAVGLSPDIEVDGFVFDLDAGDRILICSDGLTDMLEEEEIFNIVINTDDMKNCAKKLVNTANKNGGVDNITVVLAEIAR